MEKIDRLGWTVGFAIAPLSGVCLGVRSNDEGLLLELAQIVSDWGWATEHRGPVDNVLSAYCGKPSGSARRRNYHLLYSGAMRASRTLDLEELKVAFRQELQLNVIAAASDVVFYSGAVFSQEGAAVVVPARIDSYFEEISQALMRSGWQVRSRQRFSLSAGGRLGDEWGRPFEGAAQTVVLIQPDSPETRESSEHLTPGEAAMRLYQFGLNARFRPALALASLGEFLHDKTTYQLAGDVGEWLRGTMEWR